MAEKTQMDEIIERFDKIDKALEAANAKIEAIGKKVGVDKKGFFES